MCLETSRSVGTEFQAFDAAKNCRRQNAKNHLLIQQVTTNKCQWIAVIEPPLLTPAIVKRLKRLAGFGIVNYDTYNIQ